MSSVFFMLTMALYFGSTVCYLAYLLRRAETLSKVSLGITAAGFATHTGALVARMLDAGQTQLPTFHEALSFFSWMLILVFLAKNSCTRPYPLSRSSTTAYTSTRLQVESNNPSRMPG